MVLLYLVFCQAQPSELRYFAVFITEMWPPRQSVRVGSYLNQNAILPAETCSLTGLQLHRADEDGWL